MARAACIRICTLLLACCALACARQKQDLRQELSTDLARLDSVVASGNLGFLRLTIDQDSAKWLGRDRAAYLEYMAKACAVVSSHDWRDESKQSLLLSGYAMSALTVGELSAEQQVHFVEFLSLDPMLIDGPTWKELRRKKAVLFLKTRDVLDHRRDPRFDPEDRPVLNVAPPLGAGVPAGAAPESIKDAKLRADYESLIAQNAAKTRRYNEQLWLERNTARFDEQVEDYLVNAYSRPPLDFGELEALLSTYGTDQGTRDRVLQKARGHAK